MLPPPQPSHSRTPIVSHSYHHLSPYLITLSLSHDKPRTADNPRCAVLFAVPGAFTPTCSAQHLPGFIAQASALKAKGVDAVYCLSVNDKYVMKSWGDATPGFAKSGIFLVADGMYVQYLDASHISYIITHAHILPPALSTRSTNIYSLPLSSGNAEFTKALGFEKDATGSRMGIRSKRYALIVESGKVSSVNIDEKGLENSSVEKILAQL